MPRLSLYRPEKTNDYKFLDRRIKEMFTIGATDLFVHKYLGIQNTGPSNDATQPQYTSPDPTQIQDLLFLENRDRKYDPDIYRVRGHYNVQNLDFDLSQFGLFLNNDIIFITVHYNDMIETIGRKLMVGDVFELPHLTDYHPLNESLPIGLRRYYQITDANFASEGFSSTWYPHLWRIKCEPLVDSQEFADIMDQPVEKDNYLGDWDPNKTYPPGYVITYGDENYVSITDVPIGVNPPNEQYWQIDTGDTLRDIIGRYNKNIEINNAAIEEAKRILPKAGYDRSQLYVVPTTKINTPALPVNIVKPNGAPMVPKTGTVSMIRSRTYKTPSAVLRVSPENVKNLLAYTNKNIDELKAYLTSMLQVRETAPEKTELGSGRVSGEKVLSMFTLAVTGPYGTADNTYATGDQDPTKPGFTGTITSEMDYRADCDPRFQYIMRSTPRSFGYTDGYMVGTTEAPNGEPVSAGITFPTSPATGDYFLRTDYMPQTLFRWDGQLWIKISQDVRTGYGFEADDQSLLSTFINNDNVTETTTGTIPEQQPLSTILTIQPD